MFFKHIYEALIITMQYELYGNSYFFMYTIFFTLVLCILSVYQICIRVIFEYILNELKYFEYKLCINVHFFIISQFIF